ncbi:muts domain V-domain-containing protein [Phycomyces blakesleeanus]|uniref:Muts domain V-domain-containing protein n=2 Tax=Phycomyces blakesleeanus TaxID=4837 RepID=A0ABR3BCK5_PHYBL
MDEDDNEDVPAVPKQSQNKRTRRSVRKIIEESEDDNDEGDDEEDRYVPSDKEESEDEYKDVPELFNAMEIDGEVPKPTSRTTKPKQAKLDLPKSKGKESGKPTASIFNANFIDKTEQRKNRNDKFKEKNVVRYAWLQNIKDANGTPKGSPDYDPRTLYIPTSAWNGFTPFEKQYWEIKCKLWDAVVFFKKGKFFEIYEGDADIGHQEFGLKMTDRVNMRMAGVPESSFDNWASQFVAKGYKVAKVEQKETALGKSMRERDIGGKADQVVKRELSSILTAGTLVDLDMLTSQLGTYCMAIKEQAYSEHDPPLFGVCFVDTSTAEINLTYFEDDLNRTMLETLLVQIRPKELVVEKGRLSSETEKVIKRALHEPIWNRLIPEEEFWDSRRTEEEIRTSGYFGQDTDMDYLESWPTDLREAIKHPLCLSAFGGLLWYLRLLKIDQPLVSAKHIQNYDPVRSATSLVLNGQTLINLDILKNIYDGSTDGTLLKLLDNTITPFGKRLFQQWLCHPLLKKDAINDRLDAVEDLLRLHSLRDNLTQNLSKLPDLERLISRIHAGSCKVKYFLSTLSGFEKAMDTFRNLEKHSSEFTSTLIKKIIRSFPNLEDKLNYFRNAFVMQNLDMDYQKMYAMVPIDGSDEKWDEIQQNIKDIENKFERHLAEISKGKKQSFVYTHSGKDIFLIQTPKGTSVPREWIVVSDTAKFVRYRNSTTVSLVKTYKELLETKSSYIKGFTKKVYAVFDQEYKMWLLAVQCLAELDGLMSLSKGSFKLGAPSCRPQFVEQEKGMIEFKDLRHPCVVPGMASEFVPNDVCLGGAKANMIILTGPNMGGKSTLLRQTCIGIIMAQLGCYVPAESAKLTPCDKIYTRIGANDNIMAGQSTFMVELSETSRILKEATNKSMVILDELGRGTSTHDGYAIAYAVLYRLITHIGCLGVFATHYQGLCHEFIERKLVRNMYMNYFVNTDENDITFLYKLTEGICEKSFGMNIAQKAGILPSVIKKAIQASNDFEKSSRIKDSTYRKDSQIKVQNTPSERADIAFALSLGTSPSNEKSKDLVEKLKRMTL